jgi:hypothetical protein
MEVPVSRRQATSLNISRWCSVLWWCIDEGRIELIFWLALLRPTSRSACVWRIIDILLFHLHGYRWVVATLSCQIANALEDSWLNACDLVNALGGDACFGQGEGLDAHCHRVLVKIQSLRWLWLFDALDDFGVLEEAGWVRGLSSDAILDAFSLHGFEILRAAEKMGALSRSVLRHLPSTVLASYLCQFLDLISMSFVM